MFDRILGGSAMLLLAAAMVAVARGSADWAQVPWQVWVHLATIAVALALTPAILWQRRGDRRHRLFGYIWVGALAITAALSFDIRMINRGEFSPIHLFSVLTLGGLIRVVFTARTRNRPGHRKAVRQLAMGALLIAGFFTFPFDRMLGHWLVS